MLFKLMRHSPVLCSWVHMVELLFIVIFNLQVMQYLLLLLISNFELLILAFKFAYVLK